MKLGSIRGLSGMIPVLKDSGAQGPDPVYWVFSETTESKWANLTIIVPGDYNSECPKTFGHYHGVDINETYHLIEGEGVLVMQKKFFDGSGNWIEDKVEEVYLIKANPGDEILITPVWGHSWSNVGELPIISFDDWRSGHKSSDYEVIERLQGMAYYLIKENGEIKTVPNSNYKDLPEAKWVTAAEFKSIQTA